MRQLQQAKPKLKTSKRQQREDQIIDNALDILYNRIRTAAVHPREIAKQALQLNAGGVIFCHNHLSGDVTPAMPTAHDT